MLRPFIVKVSVLGYSPLYLMSKRVQIYTRIDGIPWYTLV